MSRSPYSAYAGRSSNKQPLRQSAPPPADGALSGDGVGGWGLTSMLRGGNSGVAPRPPSSDPSVGGMGSGATAKSPMAFRARRFNATGSASDSDLSATVAAANAGANSADAHGRRRSGSESPMVPSNPAPLQPSLSNSGGPPPLGRQLSSGSVSSVGSIRPSPSSGGTILASFSGSLPDGGLPPPAPLGAAGAGTAASKALRPKSSDANGVNGAGGAGAGTGTATGGTGKALRNRLSEEGGHAAGTPTLSLREKVALLQRNNKALEQQLAEAAAEAQARAAAQHEAHVAALAALQGQLGSLQGQLAAQQRANADLLSANSQLKAAAQQLQSQLEAAAVAGPPPPPPPPPLLRDKSLADIHHGLGKAASSSAECEEGASDSGGVVGGGGGGGDGSLSPRTPLGWDGLPTSSPDSSVSSTGSNCSTSTSTAAAASTVAADGGGGGGSGLGPAPPAAARPVLAHGGGGGGSSIKRISEDTPPPHPHVPRPLSAGGAAAAAAAVADMPRPHTAPRSDFMPRSPSFTDAAAAAVAAATAAALDEPLPPETTSLLVLSHSEPDLFPTPTASSSQGEILRLSPVATPSPLQAMSAPSSPTTYISGSTAAAAAAAATLGGGADAGLFAGVGPPPASPVAAAAGLSGAGVALLARQKKLIAALRAQLQQKDSAYAFLANEHSELEGQLKEVEASKREYAARYAFMVLDQDLDGHIRVDQVGSFDMFACYSAAVLEYAFKHWRFASGFKGYLNMDDFVKFVSMADDRNTKESQRFWFGVLDLDGDGCCSAEDAKWFYDAVEKDENAFVVSFEDLWHQMLDMTQPANPRRGFTAAELWKCKLGSGVIGLLLNHNNMLLHRTTAEWGRGDFPL